MKSLIEAAVMDNPPLSLRDGGIVKKGYNKEIDELRKISNSGKDFIAELEMDEKRRQASHPLRSAITEYSGITSK